MILDDHEIRRRLATTHMIRMITMRWPAQWHLARAGDHIQELRARREAATDEVEQDRLSDEICTACEHMCDLIDILSTQLPP
jgi:hypothetical protein